MSYGEKMHWTSLLAIVSGYGWYFWQTFLIAENSAGYVGRLILITIIVVIAIVISAIFFAIRHHDDLDVVGDERERNHELVAMRSGYFILSFGVFSIFVMAYFEMSFFALLNAMFAVYVLSEVVRIGHQLWLGRRG